MFVMQAPVISVFLKAVYIVLWVFSRAATLLQATKVFTRRRQSFGEHSHHFLKNLTILSNELFITYPQWTKDLRPSGRNDGINTTNLDALRPDVTTAVTKREKEDENSWL